MQIEKDLVVCDRCNKRLHTKKDFVGKASYKDVGIKSDGSSGMITKKIDLCVNCFFDLKDFLSNGPIKNKEKNYEI